jgi:hypothetical protein
MTQNVMELLLNFGSEQAAQVGRARRTSAANIAKPAGAAAQELVILCDDSPRLLLGMNSQRRKP